MGAFVNVVMQRFSVKRMCSLRPNLVSQMHFTQCQLRFALVQALLLAAVVSTFIASHRHMKMYQEIAQAGQLQSMKNLAVPVSLQTLHRVWMPELEMMCGDSLRR